VDESRFSAVEPRRSSVIGDVVALTDDGPPRTTNGQPNTGQAWSRCIPTASRPVLASHSYWVIGRSSSVLWERLSTADSVRADRFGVFVVTISPDTSRGGTTGAPAGERRAVRFFGIVLLACLLQIPLDGW